MCHSLPPVQGIHTDSQGITALTLRQPISYGGANLKSNFFCSLPRAPAVESWFQLMVASRTAVSTAAWKPKSSSMASGERKNTVTKFSLVNQIPQEHSQTLGGLACNSPACVTFLPPQQSRVAICKTIAKNRLWDSQTQIGTRNFLGGCW